MEQKYPYFVPLPRLAGLRSFEEEGGEPLWEERKDNPEEECFHEFKREFRDPIGQGSFGAVFASCRGRECDFVVKRSILEQDTPADRALHDREAYFLQLLDPVRIDGQRIVPRFVDQWYCEYRDPFRPRESVLAHFLVMERYESDMFQFGQRQAANYERASGFRFPIFPQLEAVRVGGTGMNIRTETRPNGHLKTNLFFTRNQLIRMFRIAAFLSLQHIVHGDMKPENFIQRFHEDAREIVASDFGLAGDFRRYEPIMGFAGNPPITCRTDLFQHPTRYRFARAVRWMNEFQLESYLTNLASTWILDPRAPVGRHLQLFAGLRLPDPAVANLREACSGYDDLYPHMQRFYEEQQRNGVILLYIDADEFEFRWPEEHKVGPLTPFTEEPVEEKHAAEEQAEAGAEEAWLPGDAQAFDGFESNHSRASLISPCGRWRAAFTRV